VQQSLATSFAHLYRLQSQQLNHEIVTEAQLRVTASCSKENGMAAPQGPGNDWRCYVYWHLPDVKNATAQAIYQLDVNANGRYVADGDGPNEVNGYFLVHTQYGAAPNPLWQFDGLVDLLSTGSKG
jgi:ABC-2 type transport system permease protein